MNELREGESKCSACGRELSEYVSPSHTLAQGAMLNHRYLVGGVLGEGGFGITYIGLDTLLQFKVAIKEFYPAGMVNRNNTVSNEVLSISADTARELFSKSREHFLHEARTLAKFTNEPGIVAVRDFFEENHTVYIVMEYLDGITLKSYLKQVGTISSYNTICLLMPVFQSLKKIHEKNLIHRDISPDNIMLVGEAVKLLDFGAAREFADEKSLSVMLKHGYAPMEQYRRHGKQGAWTDIYAICATVYKCITGNIPPDAPDRIYEDNLKMPSELGFECSPEFEAVLRHGLAIKAEDRIQSIDQLLDELSKVPDFDLGFDSGTAPAPIMPENKGGSNTAASPSDGEGPRLSQYVPRSSYEDNESTVYTPKPNFTAAENTDSTDSDARLSEYIPTSSSEPEPEPEPKKPEPAPAPAIPEKKSSKLIIVGAACAALLVIGGIVLFMNLKGDDSVKTSSPDSTAAATTTTATAAVTTASATVTSAPETTPAPESSAPTESETKTEPDSSTAADDSSEEQHFHILYPDLRGSLSVDNGLLDMNYSLFGLQKSNIQTMFATGQVYVSTDHDKWTTGDTVMLVPIDLGNETEEYFDSIDLYFKGDDLWMVQYQYGEEFSSSIREAAEQKHGKPIYDTDNDVRWAIASGKCMFQLYMDEVEGQKIFSQRYIYETMLYDNKMLEDGYFEKQ
ncbi:MAG: serine/threonine protein kinase [Ruminococcus sp.]|nr:serine/threonine protein kinase [Ruminococcus sp.]